MKALTVLTLLGAVTCALGGYLVAIDKSLDAAWNSFKDVHGKTYFSPLEEIRRRSIWQDNRRRINEHNAQADLGLRSYRMAVNQFADMTIEEIKMKFDVPIRGTLKNPESQRRGSENLPDSLDWEKEGYVTPVKDQGQFGSPVSFAVTGSIEGVLGIRNRRLAPLAYQQIQDCYKGGTISGAFESVIKLGGIMSESAYSNSTQNGTCHFDREKVACRLATYKSVDRTEEALKNAVANVGPITIAINAEKFYFYASGIFDDPSCAANGPNHALLVTGYGSDGGLEYWRLKNSWGTSWGENGYIRIKRNANTCNIAGYASYPVLA